ncbi:hypothetical protein KP509_03G084300 [Ceratopteris richardii]|uniref:PABS domain-containing protein n=1 Tax=Ceratopteris richardii TaxID=49495 RepID=A0A8T2V976_CERRI|nr:hypothetical protein KP509_03G084300 [Ceratopteris richardii]
MAETACIAPYPSKSMTSSSKDFPAFGPNPAPLHSYTGNGGLTSYTFNGGVPSSKPSALGPTYSSNNGIAAVASIASTGSSAYNVIQGVNSGLHSNGNPLVQSGRGSEDLSVSSVDGPPFSSSKGAICSSNEQSNPADGKAVATVELTPSRRPSLWYEEEIDESLRWSFGLTSILFTGCSRFQEIALLDTEPFGKVLTLDRKMQSAEKDEWVYHECLVHPPLLLHPSPKSVYIMGGGEGSTAREALRHKSVKKVVMCDIDEEVVKFCRSYLTCNAEAFRSSRLELVIDDAKYLSLSLSRRVCFQY